MKKVLLLIVLIIALIVIGALATKYLPVLFVSILVGILIIALVMRMLKDKGKILKNKS